MENEKTITESLKTLRDSLDDLVQMQASIALLCRAKYDALIRVGFTEGEALEIVKTRGIAP